MSERGVRRTVIARKTCGGSQSEDALMVREVLQSVIGSLRLRCGDPVARLTEALDAYALDKTFKIEDFLFPHEKGPDAQSPRCPNAVVGRSMPRSGVE